MNDARGRASYDGESAQEAAQPQQAVGGSVGGAGPVTPGDPVPEFDEKAFLARIRKTVKS